MFNFHTIGKNESRTKIVIDHKSNRLEIHTYIVLEMYLTRKVVLSFILPFASSCALNEVLRVCNDNGFNKLSIIQHDICSIQDLVQIWKNNSRGMRIKSKTVLENTLDEYNEHDNTLIGFYLGQINDSNTTMIRSLFKRKILSTIINHHCQRE